MSADTESTFDPYHVWLGIPPEEQPADYYRLLGIQQFEQNLDVIESAADRQMTHLRSFQGGDRVAESQRLLNEIASIRVSLLNSSSKQAYDDSLRKKGKSPKKAKKAQQRAESAEFPDIRITVPEQSKTAPAQSNRQRQQIIVATAAGVGLIALFVVALVLMLREEPSPSGEQRNVVHEPTPDQNPVRPVRPRVRPDVPNAPSLPDVPEGTDDPLDKEPDESGGFSDLSNEFDALAKLPGGGAETDGEVFDGSTPIGSDNGNSTNVRPAEPGPQAGRLPIPSEQELAQAAADLKTTIEKQRFNGEPTAKQLLDLAKSAQVEPSVQYLLFQQAKTAAVNSQQIEFALHTIDETAFYYELDAWQGKYELLVEINDSILSRDPLNEFVDCCHKLASIAIGSGQFDRAVLTGELATSSTVRPQAGRLRATTQALLANAQAVKSNHSEYEQALATLESNPVEMKAHLTVGSWLCFMEDNWRQGLDHLARSNDAALVEAAKQDLATEEEQDDHIRTGDTWWALSAERAQQDIVLKLRALHWYEQAATKPLKSLTGVRVQERIDGARLLQRPFLVRPRNAQGTTSTATWRQ